MLIILFIKTDWILNVIGKISPKLRTLVEGFLKNFLEGINDFRKLGYGGPCPPNGVHRYFFRLYALDIILNIKPGCSKADLMEAMQGHIISQATLMGRYTR